MKRAFDFAVAAIGLVVLSPLMVILAVLIKCDSQGPVLFKQRRIGKNFRAFLIYKFRTMKENSELNGSVITVGEDPRITRVGRLLRKTKLDELPQLINILRGEMSIVGPRPEVPQYVQLYQKEYQEILTIRPGLTDLASIKYRDEAALLDEAQNPEEEYLQHVLPDKIKLAKDYLQRSSLRFDIRLIVKTLFKIFNPRSSA